jgi:2-dehydro-3-deoxygluconokinase
MSSAAAAIGLAPAGDDVMDLVALGALITRLDTLRIPFRKAKSCNIHVSGAEFNVAANLADCFDQKTGVVTAMVRYPVGDLVHERVKAMGVKPFYKYFDHNGVTGPNIATVFSDQGAGIRAPVVFYNRANEAAASIDEGDIDFASIFSTGVRVFHSGGLYTGLSETTPKVIIEGMKAAKAAGALVSFDLNYRAKLWKHKGGVEKCQEVMGEICKHVDILLGNEEDLQMGLGFAGPDVEKHSKLDPSGFFAMLDAVRTRFPQLVVIATTLREVVNTNKHNWSAVAWVKGHEPIVAPTTELTVLDRVGGGDGFASGFIYGLLNGNTAEECVKMGWAHGALLTTTEGDTTMVKTEQVLHLAGSGSARIQR